VGFALFFKSTADFGGRSPLQRTLDYQGITDFYICDPFFFASFLPAILLLRSPDVEFKVRFKIPPTHGHSKPAEKGLKP
jgi:hypothetical protein